MTQEQKLKAIIEKAVGNGFEWYTITNAEDILGYFINLDKELLRHSYNEIIFNTRFAKAFWKDAEAGQSDLWMTELGNAYFEGEPWQYHLQQLALTPDDERIDYLYKFI